MSQPADPPHLSGALHPAAIKASLLAEVAAHATANRIRTLAWCGPVLDHFGLVTPFVETDAAILVDPSSTTHLIATLRDAGWEIFRDPLEERGILPATRAVLRHPERLIGLEVYYAIPGLFADAEVAFDILWERRVAIEMAGAQVPSLDRSMGILTVAVHCAGRIPGVPVSSDGFDFLLDQIEGALSPDETDDLVDLIGALKGEIIMAPLLAGLGRSARGPRVVPAAYARWRLKVDDVTPTLRALLDVVEAPAGAERRGRMRAGFTKLLLRPLALPRAIHTMRAARSRLRDHDPADPRGSGWAEGQDRPATKRSPVP